MWTIATAEGFVGESSSKLPRQNLPVNFCVRISNLAKSDHRGDYEEDVNLRVRLSQFARFS